MKIINDYDAVVVRSATKIDKEIIESLGENFKLIGRAGIGSTMSMYKKHQ